MLKTILVLAGLKLDRVPEILNLVISADFSVSPSINFEVREQASQLFVINVMS